MNVGVLTVSNHGSIATDDVGELVTTRLRSVGHRLVERDLVRDDRDAIRGQLVAWLEDPEIDCVIVLGGSHHVATLISHTTTVVGFGDLARWAVREHISMPVAVRAEAIQARGKLVFALGGSQAAMPIVVEHVLIPQLDVRPEAGNLVAILPPVSRSRKQTYEPPTQPMPLPALVVSLQPAIATPVEVSDGTPPRGSPTQPPPVITTDKISVIGDLPAIAMPVALPDLRRRGSRALAALMIFGAGAAATYVVNYFQTHRPVEAPPIVENEAPRPVTPAATPHEAPNPQPVTNVTVQPPDTGTAPVTKPSATKPVAKPTGTKPVAKPTTTQPAKPTDEAPVDPEAVADPHMFDPCTQETCAASNFERECCAPYKHAEPQLVIALDQAMVASTIASVMPQIEHCQDLAIHGTVKLHVVVRANGSVSDSDPREAPDPNLGECVADAVNKAHFPKTTNGGAFTKSFTF